ncbi:hypothetical protein PIB30_066916 [Stylosanthes scabra]|uniref:Uncharacterized protein n=1 Tax=Stylosanthes scabra TaxID=79078 RepID=A0ABU6RMG5_9FABA|nr:hypothetical protein [Stylosanthes scabra]
MNEMQEECQGFGSTLHIHVVDKDYIKMLIKYLWLLKNGCRIEGARKNQRESLPRTCNKGRSKCWKY